MMGIGNHGVGSTDHLSRQTMRIKTVMNHNQENDQKNRPRDLSLKIWMFENKFVDTMGSGTFVSFFTFFFGMPII